VFKNTAIAKTPDEQAAVKAWMDFYQISAGALNTFGMNLSTKAEVKAFEAVATGKAHQWTYGWIAERRRKRYMTVGENLMTMNAIQIQGKKATIQGCVDDKSYEVDEQGKAVTPAPGLTGLTDTLVRSGTTWRVSEIQVTAGKCPAGA
jgi:hypothetical protein